MKCLFLTRKQGGHLRNALISCIYSQGQVKLRGHTSQFWHQYVLIQYHAVLILPRNVQYAAAWRIEGQLVMLVHEVTQAILAHATRLV
jgi:hypothetical protein